MGFKPWLTSNDLINQVKLKISLPTTQATYSDEDILNFASSEMQTSLVPSVLTYHEDYFVTYKDVPLLASVARYEIPERAIGMKLRDLFWADEQKQLFEMTKISSEDKAFFQRNVGANQAIHKYFIEGNDIVLTPQLITPTGVLRFFYYLRPNQLVKDERAAIIKSFQENVVVSNASLLPNDTISIKGIPLTAIAGIPTVGSNEFQIGVDSITTATNLVNLINSVGLSTATNNSFSSATINLKFQNITDSLSVIIECQNPSALVLDTFQTIEFESAIPSNFANNAIVDFLQTKSGHRTCLIDIPIRSNGISGTFVLFDTSNFTNPNIPPFRVDVGDYICLQYECIIPQIPTDLHSQLAERTSARILASMGDQAGLQAANMKIQELVQSQGSMLDSRSEGSPAKITNRHSLLRYNRIGRRRTL